jgi:serine/threonine protein kinase
MNLQIREIIGTRYQILRELEGGGFGKIFVAEDLLKFNSECVVKQFIQPYDEESERGKKARELFQTEAKILLDLENYPQVPNLLAFFESEGCLVQELIKGESLAINELEPKTFFN